MSAQAGHRVASRCLLGLLFFSVVAVAEVPTESNPWDLSFRVGVASGNLSEPATNGGQPFAYQGSPLGLATYLDLSNDFTFEVALDFAVDFSHFQVTRDALAVQLDYHLLGGARRRQADYANVLLVTRNSYNISLTIREQFARYGSSSSAIPYQGSVATSAIGVQFRTDISEGAALVLDFYYPFYNLHASVDNLSAQVEELILSIRFFL